MDTSLIELVGDGDLDGVICYLERVRSTHGQASSGVLAGQRLELP